MCKVKGLTLNYRASNLVSSETLEKMLKQDVESIDVVYPHFIQRTGKHEVRTLPLTKQYKIVYDKIQRLPEFKTLPFGIE